MVCFEKDSIKTDVPSEKTMISKDHLILNKGKMVEAKELINNKQIYKVKYNGEILYNVLMEKHERMSINNIICETLNPENMVAKITNSISNLNGKQKKEFIKKANNYIVENKHNISKKQFVKTYHQTHIEPIETNRNVFMFKK